MKIDKIIVLLLGMGLIGWSIYPSKIEVNNPSPVVTPAPIVIPELKEHIIYDDYPKTVKLAETYSKQILVIFGADWCPYCKSLKKDLDKLDGLKKYLVCIINADKDHYNLVKKFNVKGLPTSIIVDSEEHELARQTGYKKQSYESWLNDTYEAQYTSWLN